MANKMLVDANHPEETRVVVVRGSRVEEFDFESASKKQLRGNIYLAKVTRVEPSLQAAFVDYGGNRHGFLAFSEIHPDYYQIPVADRLALLEEEARAHAESDRREDRASDEARRPRPGRGSAAQPAEANGGGEVQAGSDQNGDGSGDEAEAEEDVVESVGAEDALEELPERRSGPKLRRQYKIQEVIKRRQILLVQVVKEERGTKGAALTTYLSLAGRYSVLMPNTARGGGISRKITNVTDRKRLKAIAQDLDVPEGMGVILRTAGAARTKAEVKRDFEYLLRLWENVRDLTLKSTAPTLVYEEGSLIKRSIRDLYNKDIDEILVAGEDAYREAKDFMRMLMPSHAKNVKPYRDPVPIFTRFGVESQLDAMFSPHVTLRSGGYIVINQTEALVSIDVNSGKATREHNIEDTALQTNLEAADEVARQLRLRDLAGLVVIDFIDMEEKRNNRSVERRLKECLKNDRARIQVGRISHFGLLEMSRQRIRTGVLESSMVLCQHCSGTGMVRSTESVALHVLRSLEEILIKGATHHLCVRTRTPVALYILNQKRGHLTEIERRFGLTVAVLADDHASANGHLFMLERGEPLARPVPPTPARVQPDSVGIDAEPAEDEQDEGIEAGEEDEERTEARPRAEGRDRPESRERPENGDDEGGRRRRRRRRRRGGRNGPEQLRAVPPAVPEGLAASSDKAEDDEPATDQVETEEAAAESDDESAAVDTIDAGGPEGDERRSRRRRGRRGGRRTDRPEGVEAADTTRFGAAPEGDEQAPLVAGNDDLGETVAVSAAGDVTPLDSAGLSAAEATADGTDIDVAEPAIAPVDPVPTSADGREDGAAAPGSTDRAAEEPASAREAQAIPDVLVVDREMLLAELRGTPSTRADEHGSLNGSGPEHSAETEQPREDAAPRDEALPAGSGGGPQEEHPRPSEADTAGAVPAEAAAQPVPPPAPEPEDPNRPKRTGWWARRSFF